MELKVIGSGSSGNCYLLENETECLVIEAGLPFLEVKKALNFDITKINGVLVTHCHADHAKYAKEYERAGIPVFKPYENLSMSLRGVNNWIVQAFPEMDNDGNWKHSNGDGSPCPCFGFLIKHPEIGKLVYVTDTEFVKWRFKDVNHILIEANYDKDTIDDTAANYVHVMRGHMSIQTTCNFIFNNKSSHLVNVILCHLSANNGDADSFIAKAKEVFTGNVKVAYAGNSEKLDLIPF